MPASKKQLVNFVLYRHVKLWGHADIILLLKLYIEVTKSNVNFLTNLQCYKNWQKITFNIQEICERNTSTYTVYQPAFTCSKSIMKTWKHENICSKLTIKTLERRHFFANMILSRMILDHLRWTRAGLSRLADWCSSSKFATWLFYKTESMRNRARASSQWCWRFLFGVEMILFYVKLVKVLIMKLYPLSNQCLSWRISKFLYKQQCSVSWSYRFCKPICQMVLANVYYWPTGQYTGFYMVGTSVMKELKSFEISFSILIGITFKYIILLFLCWSSPRNKH